MKKMIVAIKKNQSKRLHGRMLLVCHILFMTLFLSAVCCRFFSVFILLLLACSQHLFFSCQSSLLHIVCGSIIFKSVPLYHHPSLLLHLLSSNSFPSLTQIKSKGNNLSAGYWKDLEPSILPLHRAVSGLHFHSSVKLLLSAINTLIELGADVNVADKMGNTALHKAVTVCTSRYVTSVPSYSFLFLLISSFSLFTLPFVYLYFLCLT